MDGTVRDRKGSEASDLLLVLPWMEDEETQEREFIALDRLPGGQRVAWRANSGLLDGKANGVRSRKSNLIDHKSRPAPLGNGIFA